MILNAKIIYKIMGIKEKKPAKVKPKRKPNAPSEKAISAIWNCLKDNGLTSSSDMIDKTGYSTTTVFLVMSLLEASGESFRNPGRGMSVHTYFGLSDKGLANVR